VVKPLDDDDAVGSDGGASADEDEDLVILVRSCPSFKVRLTPRAQPPAAT
jgi:hypothetical protein